MVNYSLEDNGNGSGWGSRAAPLLCQVARGPGPLPAPARDGPPRPPVQQRPSGVPGRRGGLGRSPGSPLRRARGPGSAWLSRSPSGPGGRTGPHRLYDEHCNKVEVARVAQDLIARAIGFDKVRPRPAGEVGELAGGLLVEEVGTRMTDGGPASLRAAPSALGGLPCAGFAQGSATTCWPSPGPRAPGSGASGAICSAPSACRAAGRARTGLRRGA